jgi:F0F1-type ATP synthase membrane subunit b/b'
LNRKEEGMNKNFFKLLLGAVLFCGGIAIAQKTPPVQNVNPSRHPNIAAAQRLSEKAYEKIVAAQQANEFDMEGHAKKAKELLEQANEQLKQAAEAANQNRK